VPSWARRPTDREHGERERDHRRLGAHDALDDGPIEQIRTRLIGLLCSGMIRPRTKITIALEPDVTERRAAAAIERSW